MDEPGSTSLNDRIAALEERTRPKPKTATDIIKDWAGVGTLAIALLYSFPLGVWDRFVVPPAQQKTKRINDLRDGAVRLAQLEADFARSYSAIQDDFTRSAYSRAMSSQKLALITSYIKPIDELHNELSVPEILLLAYNVGQSGQRILAERMYDSASKKSADEKNLSLQSDSIRLKGQLYFAGLSGTDIVKFRENYATAIKLLLASSSPFLEFQASNSVFEWAQMELAAGDWACGQALGTRAIGMVGSLPPISPDIQTSLSAYRVRLAQFQKQSSQPELGCPKEFYPWP